MDRDYFSVHAQYPWAEQQRVTAPKRGRRPSGDTPEQIRFCLSCAAPYCNNCMKSVKRGGLPRRLYPCSTCRNQRLCSNRGWTCKDKATLEGAHG